MELPADPKKFLTQCPGLMIVLIHFTLSGMLSLLLFIQTFSVLQRY